MQVVQERDTLRIAQESAVSGESALKSTIATLAARLEAEATVRALLSIFYTTTCSTRIAPLRASPDSTPCLTPVLVPRRY